MKDQNQSTWSRLTDSQRAQIVAILVQMLWRQLAEQGEDLPAICVAGGFTFEDQIFKGLAMGAPFVKLVGMARSPIAAAMVGKTIGKSIGRGEIPVYVQRFGQTKEEIFVTAAELRKELGAEYFENLPTGAIGLYTYYERLAQGLRQLMAGARKFKLDDPGTRPDRGDLVTLTREAGEISGIPFVSEHDAETADAIIDGAL